MARSALKPSGAWMGLPVQEWSVGEPHRWHCACSGNVVSLLADTRDLVTGFDFVSVLVDAMLVVWGARVGWSAKRIVHLLCLLAGCRVTVLMRGGAANLGLSWSLDAGRGEGRPQSHGSRVPCLR